MALGEPYTTGTISVTSGSDTVTGLGTMWASTIEVGDMVSLDGLLGAVEEVLSQTSLRLYLPWAGQSRSGVTYAILPTSPTRYEAAETQELQRAILSRIDAGLLPSGATRPQSVAGGGLWRKIVSATAHQINYHDGADDIALLTIDPVANAAKLPAAAAPRELLTSTRSYYVRTDGSDTNTGLTNTTGGAFRTIQKAVDAAAMLDCAGQAVVIQVTGSHTESVNLKSILGASSVTIIGDETTPANVTITGSTAWCFRADSVVGNWYLRGMRLLCPVAGAGSITAIGAMTTVSFHRLDFGASAGHHIGAQFGARMQGTAGQPYSISGGALYHAVADGGLIYLGNRTITLTGTPSFLGCFALAQKGTGIIDAGVITFVGGATGVRYVAQFGGQISTIGGGANYFPGDAAGSGTNFGVSPYGQYS
ncbi:MAG: hypothetical protein HZA68_07865 [Rhodovulum sp.]|nr:hypothetical protein [Rhodovulum sp.]